MRRRRRRSSEDGGFDRIAADLFAGFLVSVLLLLVIVVLQTVEIRELRRINSVFRRALDSVAEGSSAIELVDGRLVVLAESLFETGSWEINPDDLDAQFGQVRTDLANATERLDSDLDTRWRTTDATAFVEIRVLGHTDCRPYRAGILDNLDLSSLRAVALARYLTQSCVDDSKAYTCCSDGSSLCGADGPSKRLDPTKWVVLPVGRSALEPRELPPELTSEYPTNCADIDERFHERQRRVVVEIVPRLDRLLSE